VIKTVRNDKIIILVLLHTAPAVSECRRTKADVKCVLVWNSECSRC